jgi:heat shock protein HslJ
MKKFYYLIFCAVAVICISACTSNKSGNKTAAASFSDLTGKYWKLTSLDGKIFVKDSLSEAEPHIVFKSEDKSLAGNGGCNTIYAKYRTGDKNKISVYDLVSTKMACDNMNAEMQLFDALKETDSWQVKNDTLLLQNSRQEIIAGFVAVPGK